MTKTTVERAKFKREINKALFADSDIRTLLIGDTTNLTDEQIRQEFKEHVFSHLFIDDTIEIADTFIFYDVVFPRLRPNVKQCQVHMYLICHREILDSIESDKYYGDRVDVLTQMVENALINNQDTVHRFGIGELQIDSIEIYNALRFYGTHLIFSVPNFR